MYHKGSDSIWRRCVRQHEKSAVLREAHRGIEGGHYAGEATTDRCVSRVEIVDVLD